MVKVHESDLNLLTGKEKLTENQFHTLTARHFEVNGGLVKLEVY
tara:strand:- start:406 stop:537 length:132 start_codon:yes stop_codon:yes gene_type:complete